MRWEVDNVTSNFDPGLGHVKGNVSYEELDDRIPYVAASFTGWKYRKMTPIHHLTKEMDDKYKDPFEIAKSEGLLKRQTRKPEDMNKKEKLIHEAVTHNEEVRYTYNWPLLFK